MSRAGGSGLHFRQPPKRGKRLLWAAAALAVSLALVWGQRSVEDSIQRQQAAARTSPVPAVAPGPARKSPREPSLSEAGLAQMIQQLALINRDWNGLLASLVPADADIRLLTLDVDPVTGSVRVSASATTAAQANDYTALLQQRGQLRQVKLMALDGQPQQTIFEVSAQWAP